MATAKRAAMAVGIDVKKLSKELGAKVKEGKVTAVRGKYFVTVGALKKEIVVGDTTPEAEIKALAGSSVGVVMAGRAIVAIGGLPKKPWIVCYIPVPDLIKKVREGLRGDLLNRYADLKVIPAEAADKLKSLGR
jgi:hypothetical protein